MVAPFDRTKARPPNVRNGLDENISLLFPANELGGLRVMNKPFCIPEIEVTTNSFPDTRVAVNMPLAEMPAPLNEKSNVSANILWAPVSDKKRTATAAKIRDPRRIQNPPFAGW